MTVTGVVYAGRAQTRTPPSSTRRPCTAGRGVTERGTFGFTGQEGYYGHSSAGWRLEIGNSTNAVGIKVLIHGQDGRYDESNVPSVTEKIEESPV